MTEAKNRKQQSIVASIRLPASLWRSLSRGAKTIGVSRNLLVVAILSDSRDFSDFPKPKKENRNHASRETRRYVRRGKSD